MKTYTTYRAYKFRAYPSQAYQKDMDEVLELCRALYNRFLFERKVAYQWLGLRIGKKEQSKRLTKIRTEDERYRKLNRRIFQGVLTRLDEAYQSFFRRVKAGDNPGYPRFKGKGRYSTIFLDTDRAFQIKGNYLCVKGMERLKFRPHREIEGEIVEGRIMKSLTGKYYVIFTCKQEKEMKLSDNMKLVGIDLGLTTFATLSDGTTIENPRFIKQMGKELERKHQLVSSKKLGSNRRRKAIVSLAKSYERLSNRRNYFIHSEINKLLKQYSVIVMEKLQVKKMTEGSKAKGLNKSIQDASWSKFLTTMEYKAEEAGVSFLQTNPKNTTRRCSQCGVVNEKISLSVRAFECVSCGYSEGRDLNASYNILWQGLGRDTAFALSENHFGVANVP